LFADATRVGRGASINESSTSQPETSPASLPWIDLRQRWLRASHHRIDDHVTVIDVTADQTAAQTTDDVLRSLSSFSLFRRSSSVVAHPTSQGANLRGGGAHLWGDYALGGVIQLTTAVREGVGAWARLGNGATGSGNNGQVELDGTSGSDRPRLPATE